MSDAYGRLERYLRGWSDLPDAELAKVRQVFRPSAEPRGALLVRAGDRPQRVCFIVRGLVRIFHADPDGTERTQGFRAEDQLVCAYSAMLLGGPARLYVQAREPCSLLSATVTAFGEL